MTKDIIVENCSIPGYDVVVGVHNQDIKQSADMVSHKARIESKINDMFDDKSDKVVMMIEQYDDWDTYDVYSRVEFKDGIFDIENMTTIVF